MISAIKSYKSLPTSATLSVNKSKGFTLVELLVVVSIIGILSVIGIVVYSDAQERAIEAKAKADVDAFFKAYELKFNAATGTYPRSFTANDFVGGIPVQPNGSPYEGCDPSSPPCDLLRRDYDKPFELCVKLSDATEYCKKSAQLSGSTPIKKTLADFSASGGGGTGGGGGGTGGTGGTSPSPTTSAGGGGTGGTGGTSSPSPSPASTCQPNTTCTFKALSAAYNAVTGDANFNLSCDLRRNGAINSSDFICLGASTTLYGGLQTYWDMEETSGDRLNYDTTKTSLKLTVSGASLGTETGPSNMGNAAGNFQSSNAYLTMADQPEVSITGTKTWAFWLKHDAGRIAATALGKVDGDNLEYWVRLPYSAGTFIQFLIKSITPISSSCSTPTEPIAINQWNFVVAWYDQGTNTVGIQVNNGTARTAICSGSTVDGTGALRVGALAEKFYLNGYIDGLGIWSRLLTDQEKNELYNSGNGKQL